MGAIPETKATKKVKTQGSWDDTTWHVLCIQGMGIHHGFRKSQLWQFSKGICHQAQWQALAPNYCNQVPATLSFHKERHKIHKAEAPRTHGREKPNLKIIMVQLPSHR